MRVVTLRVDGVRCLSNVELSPAAGLNVFLGGNGAGKTSLLEALHLLGYGRSFRSHDHDVVIARGRPRLTVFAEVERNGLVERVGLERGRSTWRALADGEQLFELAELVRRVPVLAFSPESHALISGPAEGRRRFLDWLLFHVEPNFSGVTRRYGRCLRQRNAALKSAGDGLSAWSEQLAASGEELTVLREAVFPVFAMHAEAALRRLLPELGSVSLHFSRGWRDGTRLHERLDELIERERHLGHTLAGPHRANWSARVGDEEIKSVGSRGQQKLVAVAVLIAAAEIFRERSGHAPIILLDDITSELDDEHQQRVLETLRALGAQLWVTGTHATVALRTWSGDAAWFHVEQGQIAPHQA